jgi:hypothetical protein
LASLCSPSARPPRAQKGLSARLCSYIKFHRSWRAQLREAQSSRFGGRFELLARLQVESKHNLKTGRLSWAIAPNTREWPDLSWLRLVTAWALGRAGHDHPSKHTHNGQLASATGRKVHADCGSLVRLLPFVFLFIFAVGFFIFRWSTTRHAVWEGGDWAWH